MNIMTKRGSLDNVVTYEHICDTTADMDNIDPNYITLGSICIVINGEGEGMEVYMANSNKEWNSIAMGAGSGDSGSGASSLVDLLDVEVLNPTDGQTLTYDATAQKWINGGGYTGGVMVVHSNGTALDKTWQEIFDAMKSGMFVIINSVLEVEGYSSVHNAFIEEASHADDTFVVQIDETNYITNSPDDYPAMGDEG